MLTSILRSRLRVLHLCCLGLDVICLLHLGLHVAILHKLGLSLGWGFLGREYVIECCGMKCKQLNQEASGILMTHEISTPSVP